MDADAPNLIPALLRWANTFPLSEPVDTFQKLKDGQAFWRMLNAIDSDYFTGDLPEAPPANADNWIPRWQNLKHINRLVINFIRDECGELQETTKRMNPDLKSIAIDGSQHETKQMLKAVLLASMYSPKSNQRMVKVMTGLGVDTSAPIANWIQAVKSHEQRLAESALQTDVDSDIDRISSPEPDRVLHSKAIRDPELENEEKLITAHANIKALEQKNAVLTAELQQVRESSEKLEHDLTETRYQLERSAVSGTGEEAFNELQQRAARDRDYIAGLEADLESTREQLETQERQLERYKMDSEEKNRVQEELQKAYLERDELLQKANANENLRKKIQTLQETDKNNQSLRQELEKTRQDLKTMQTFKDKCISLQKEIAEVKKSFENSEQFIADEKITRKKLDHDIRMISQRYEAAKEQKLRDNELIQDQQNKIRDLESGFGGAAAPAGDSLNEEFSGRDAAYKNLKQKCDDLEAEIARMRSLPDTGENPEIDYLKSQVESYKERSKSLEEKYLNSYDENLRLDTAIKDLQDGVADSKPVLEMREKLKQETEKATSAEKKAFDIQSDFTAAKVKLQETEAKLAAAGKDVNESLSELKKSTEAEEELLKTENARLLENTKKNRSEIDELRSLFRLSIVDRGSKNGTGLDSEEEYKLMRAQMQTVIDDHSRLDEVAQSATARIEKGRQALEAAKTQAEEDRIEHEETVNDLRNKLKAAEEEAKNGTKNPIEENLQTQLKLMTSAWYDITRRIQSDAVVVQRRNDAPKSFLNRQRKLINNPTPSTPPGGSFSTRR